MSPDVPRWLLAYAAVAALGCTVLLVRIWTATPPLEFTLLAGYGYVWLTAELANTIARRIEGEPVYHITDARS